MRIGKLKIDTESFLKKGVKRLPQDNFGVYCFCGHQGTGKTLSAVKYAYEVQNNRKIWANFNLNLPNVQRFHNLSDIWDNTDENQLFIIDEVFKKYTKNSRVDKEFLSWLMQSRKSKRVVILIAQFWAELPLTLRRTCKRTITSHSLGNLQLNTWGDAEQMSWSDTEQDFVCPTTGFELFKRNKIICNLYNTNERVNLG